MKEFLKPNELVMSTIISVEQSIELNIIDVSEIVEQCLLLDNGENVFVTRYPNILESD